MSRPALDDEEAWRELVAWRHPEVNLNRLQVALLQENKKTWWRLWNEHFLREELYRDENGRLVNHPLHLYQLRDSDRAFDEIKEDFPSVDHIRDELFYEEGLVDLTMSRLRRKPSRPSQGQSDMDTSPSTTGPGQSGTQDLPPEDDRHHSAAGGNNDNGGEDRGEKEAEEEHREEVAGSKNVSATRTLRDVLDVHSSFDLDQPQTMTLQPYRQQFRLLPSLPFIINENTKHGRLFAQVVEKLCGSWAQLSTAELYWSMIEDLKEIRYIDEYVRFLNTASLPQEYERDAVILQCQLAGSLPGSYCSMCLAWRFFRCTSIEVVMEAARFLPPRLVGRVITAYNEFGELKEELGEVLDDRLENWTFQDLCVIEIMRLVGGDARKVWSLEGLPVPLKELFHIPFGKRCEELKKRHEERKQKRRNDSHSMSSLASFNSEHT